MSEGETHSESVDDERLGVQVWACLKSRSGAPFMHALAWFAKRRWKQILWSHKKVGQKSSANIFRNRCYCVPVWSSELRVELGIFRQDQWSLRNNKTIHSNKSQSIIHSEHMLMILRLLLLASSSWMDCKSATWTRNNGLVYTWY